MNKKTTSISGFIILISLFVLSNNSYAQCKLSSGPTIDQTIDALWANATPVAIATPLSPSSTPAGFSAQWRSVYTTTNIYFLIEVTKTGSLYNQNGATWWYDDAVEVYIDGNHSGGTVYDGSNDVQYGFRYNDGTTIQTGGSNPANSTTGVSYSFYTTAAGYNVEILIPWATINTTPTSGNAMGIEVAVDVSGGASRITQMLTYDATGQAFNNPSLFGTITLNNCVTGILSGDSKNLSAFADPNPFSNQTQLTLPDNDNYTLTINSMQGKEVKIINNINNGKVVVSSDGMETGLYIYSLVNQDNGTIYNGKFVVNK